MRGQPVLEELARAKVNLTLRVLGRRADGYHALDSIVAFADVGDLVRLLPGAPTQVRVTGPFATEIVGENLA
ncbi:MAG: 4-(cytidine 5'-diphospho)-2-C-methyl-D-erythritol kinase, partial [Hyphomicrobiaceae bacterium]